ncbi:Aminopeptidase N [Armadillidium nasatum]|uniref:Aminopeptidase N n=1 Tax=Armadillidium nasatum TaxID=96803 RepID=A0A5N5TN21_9CRUS|nr:Aminopeptidase N [Armadillidium nasatum]
MLETTKDYGLFKEFMTDLLSPLTEFISNKDSTGTEVQFRLLKAEISSWLCQMEYKTCQEKAGKIQKILETNDIKELREGFRDSELCLAVKHGHEDVWLKVFKFFKQSKSIEEKSKYLRSLGCTSYVWLLNRYLHLMNEPDSGLLRQDGLRLYQAATQTPVGIYVAWNTFRTSWKVWKNFSDL